MRRIMDGLSAPIIPTWLTNSWGGIFDLVDPGRVRWRFPSGARHPVGVAFGPPLDPATPPAEVQRHVDALAETAADG
jgi:hypothetical protein